MLKKITKIIVMLFVLNGYSQLKIDPKNIQNLTKVDTLIANEVLGIIENEQDNDVWMKYNDKLLMLLSKQLKTTASPIIKKSFIASLASCYGNRGYYYSNVILNEKLGNDNFQKGLQLFKSINDKTGVYNMLSNLGNLYNITGQTDKVLETFNQVYILSKQNKDELAQAKVLSDIANVYFKNGAEAKAAETYNKSLRIIDKLKNEKARAETYRMMSMVYTKQEEYKIAEKLLLNNIAFFTKNSDRLKLIETYYNLCFTYLNTDNKVLFNKNFKLGFDIALKSKTSISLSNYSKLKRKYFLQEKKIDSAKKYSDLQLKYLEIEKPEPDYSYALLNLSEILLLQKQLLDAEKYGLQAYHNFKKYRYPSECVKASKNLKEIYTAKNNIQQAFYYANIELKTKDSLLDVNEQNYAIKSMFAYETEKKDSQINQLSQAKKIATLQSEKQKSIFLTIILGCIGLLLSGIFLFQKFKATKQNELLKSELEKFQADKNASQSELKALRSQMNPHFIFNALNSIQHQFMFGDKNLANKQMSTFTTLTRNILEVSSLKVIKIATEIEILTKYLDLEKMRFKDEFNYTISCSNLIDQDYHQIPPMLVQPFVENSLKHGLLHKEGIKNITITFNLDTKEEYIICVIEDNGVGRQKSAQINAQKLNKHESFSTQSVEQRLLILNEHNTENVLQYEDLMDENGIAIGTKATLKISIS